MGLDDLKDKYAGLTPAQKAAVIAGTAIISGGTVIPIAGALAGGSGLVASNAATAAAAGGPGAFLSSGAQSLRDAVGSKGMDLLGRGAKAGAYYIPNKFHREYNKQVLANAQRLYGARSGLTKGQEDAAIAKANMVISATQQERQAQLARAMGGMQTGASGVGAEAQRQLTKDTMAQQRAATSAVQTIGINKLERDQKQAQAGLLRSGLQENKQRDKALAAFYGTEKSDEESEKDLLEKLKNKLAGDPTSIDLIGGK